MARNMPKQKQYKGMALSDVEIKEPQPEAVTDTRHSLQERALLVRSAVSRWYGTGADEEVVAELRAANNANGEIGTFTKRYMDRQRLAKINSITADWRKYHREVTLPWGDSGARLLSIDAFFAYKKRAASAERDFYIAVEEMLADYPKAVDAQKTRLGDLWRAHDYPSVDALRERFKFNVLVEPIPLSDDFRLRLSKDEAEELKKSYDQEVKVRMRGAVRDVFQRMQEVVAELNDKLGDPSANIRKGSFESLRKLCAALPQLNAVVQDGQIAALGRQIASDLLSADAHAINEDTAARSDVKSKADKVLAALKPLQHNWSQPTVQ